MTPPAEVPQQPTERIMQRAAKTGDKKGWRDCEPTGTPGLFMYSTPCSCDECDDLGIDPDECEHGPFLAWRVLTQAGVLVSSYGTERPEAERLALAMANLGVDFTLPFEEVNEAALAPGMAERAWEIYRSTWAADPVANEGAERA